MALIVQKFGGTSVRDIERINEVAGRIASFCKKGDKMVVVVSAMAGETDRLIGLARQIAEEPAGREYDMLISTGEQVTSALLAMALQHRGVGGVAARSFLGHQIRLVTDSAFTKARIKSIDARMIHDELDQGMVVVIAGFQGIDSGGNITTLGRGGSDTTAVAIAAALNADLCEIYTDVDGVYTADPRVCEEARKIGKISYEEMLELASVGAKVLQIRSVEMAAKYNVPLVVRSSFNYEEGTLVTKEDKDMEKVVVAGIACDKNEAKVAVRHVADRPGIAAKLFTPLSNANINVDMIVQNVSAKEYTDITFTVPRVDLKKTLKILKTANKRVGFKGLESDDKVAKISVVGVGMRSHTGVASLMFSTLAKNRVNIQMISTSEIKISVVIKEADMQKAVRELHRAFHLEKRS